MSQSKRKVRVAVFALFGFLISLILGSQVKFEGEEAIALQAAVKCKGQGQPQCIWGGESLGAIENLRRAKSDYMKACKNGRLVVSPARKTYGRIRVLVSCDGSSPSANHLVEISYLIRAEMPYGVIRFLPTTRTYWQSCPDHCDLSEDRFIITSNM